MKHLFLLIILGFFHPAYAADAAKCVDGSSTAGVALFSAATFLTDLANEGLIPEVDYSPDGKPQGINWSASSGFRRTVTVIGRYEGREIIDITFHSLGGSDKDSNALFALKLLAYRTEKSVRSPLQPFFIRSGENLRGYEQIFEGAPNEPFSLTVRNSIPGNGVFWSSYRFRFDEHGAWIEEIQEGGRKTPTTTTTFSADGQIKSVEKNDEN